MNRISLLICLALFSCVQASAQHPVSIKEFLAKKQSGTRVDTVKVLYDNNENINDYCFVAVDESGEMKVQLDKTDLDSLKQELRILDIRPGDTLVIAGHRTAAKRIKAKKPAMISARIQSMTTGPNHAEMKRAVFYLDSKPMFMGQEPKAFSAWVNAQLRYPESSKAAGNQGTVLLSFRIGEDGVINNIELLESSGDIALDAEACRVVACSPAWTPAYAYGSPIAITFTFPVIFRLNGDNDNYRQ